MLMGEAITYTWAVMGDGVSDLGSAFCRVEQMDRFVHGHISVISMCAHIPGSES